MTGASIYAPPQGPIRILHRDTALLVADKPPGLLSVPGKGPLGHECLLAHLAEIDPEVRLVHRLDRDTSGVMVFARHPHGQRHLGLQFERRHTRKRYVARVHGRIEQDAGEIDLPLIADWPNRPRQMVSTERGKPALTAWEVLERHPTETRIALMPTTGRSHQLRVHMAALGHPILGDPLYGQSVAPGAPRMMLHAEHLALRHPDGGALLTFDAPTPF